VAAADASASFAVDLVDGTSGPAKSAADALKRLHGQLDADTKALAAMQKAMRNLNQGSSVNIEQAKKLREQIAQKKAAISQATSSILALGGSLEKNRGGKMTSLLEQLTQQAQGMPGPLGVVVGRFESLKALLAGGAIAVGLMAIVAAMTALTAAALLTTAALLKYGLAQANARRAELLRLEGLTKLRFWYQAAAGNAKEMQLAIDQVSANSSLGRGELVKYTDQLYRMGLRGQNLSDALEGVAIKAAVQGDAAAQAFAGWAAGAALTGRSVRKLADDVKARLGGIAQRKLLDLDVQTEKLRESFGVLFQDLKIEGLLGALREVNQLFSQNTATGRALKALVEALFNPMLKALEDAGPLAKRFFQGMVIGALLVGITVLKLRKWFRDTFGDTTLLKGLSATNTALYAGVAVVSALVAGVAMLAAGFVILASPVIAVGLALYQLYRAAQTFMTLWESLDWKKLGASITEGIVAGLKTGAKWVVETIKGLGLSAWKAFRSALGIASPSKAFAKLGLAIPQGLEVGIARGAPRVQHSVGRLVEPPDASSSSSSAPSSSSRPAAAAPSAGVQLSIGEMHVHTRSENPREMAQDFVSQLVSVLEGASIQLGAPVPGGG
jgi:hypothetical protein